MQEALRCWDAAIEQARAEGQFKGEAQGEARGRALGEANVTLRQLNRRYSPLTEATTEHIQALAEALLDFSGPADLATWMEEHGG